MIKAIAFLKRKAGMSREDFIHRYESVHVPLIRSIAPQIIDYRRNYIVAEGAFVAAGLGAPEFDVVTELWYSDRADYDAAMGLITEPQNAGRIAADEAQLFDRAWTRFYVVEEYGC